MTGGWVAMQVHTQASYQIGQETDSLHQNGYPSVYGGMPLHLCQWWVKKDREFWVKHENVGLTLHPVQAQI